MKFISFRTLGSLLAEEQQGGLPWWAWVLIIILIILILLLLWRRLGRSRKKVSAPAKAEQPVVQSSQKPAPPVAAAPTAIPVPAAPVKPDDLTIIEGIGPKIASVLQAAGITTFTQLAGADIGHLDKILKDAGLRLADPGTWPDQARLAAGGKWDELKVLQDNLKGGRRA